jgi:hypothetical protein
MTASHISVDGSRLKANASKHRGLSYQRSGELIEQLEVATVPPDFTIFGRTIRPTFVRKNDSLDSGIILHGSA